MSCAVRGCTNCRRFTTADQNISFHVFPRDGFLQNEWLKILSIDKDHFVRSKNKIVCSEHFKKEDYYTNIERKILKPNSVPSLKLYYENSNSSTMLQQSIESCFDGDAENQTESEDETEENLGLPETISDDTNTVNSSKRKRIMVVKTTHPYSTSSAIEKENFILKLKQEVYRKKLYRAKKTIISLKKEIADMKIVIDYLSKDQEI